MKPMIDTYCGRIITASGTQSLYTKLTLQWREEHAEWLAMADGNDNQLVMKQLKAIVTMLSIKDAEHRIMEVLALKETDTVIDHYINFLNRNDCIKDITILSMLSELSVPSIRSLMGQSGQLQRMGLLNSHSSRLSDTKVFSDYYVNLDIVSALNQPQTGKALLRYLIPSGKLRASLSLKDFDHLATERDLMLRLLKATHASKAKGVNILLYGPVGTGKTELCKTVCDALSITLYAANGISESGSEPGRSRRISDLLRLQKLFSHQANAVILFDEMEDFTTISPLQFEESSKLYMNQLVENNEIPILWTSNDIRLFDPALLRRMSLILHIDTPPASQRALLWHKLLQQTKPTGGNVADLAQSLAGRYSVAPAVAVSAIAGMQLADASHDELCFMLDQYEKAMGKYSAPIGFMASLP